MRRRVLREFGTIAGVAVILGVLVLTNSFVRRSSLAEQMIDWRIKLEKQAEESGKITFLKWPILQATTGGYFSGPTFTEELKPWNGKTVNMMGFQVPVEQFRDMTEFLLLPMPIECYFCQSPPMKDVVLVQMAEGEVAPLIKEPVTINGTLELHEGAKTQFFYVIKDAKWGKGAPNEKMHRRDVPIEHQLPHNKDTEPLMEGTGVPQAAPVEDIIKSAVPTTPTPAPAADGPVTAPAPSAPAAEVPAAPAPAPTPEAGAAAPSQ